MQWRLLSSVPEEDVRLLLSLARRRRFDRGEVVFHEGDPGDSLHLIASGRFSIRVTTPLGDTVWLAVRGPGDAFGEIALAHDDQRRSATVAALERAETFAVYKDDFERVRREHRELDRILISLLAGTVRSLNARLLEALYLPAELRLVRRLLDLAEAYASDDGIVIPLTQEELAEFVGTTRATVNQLLHEEQERGTIEVSRGRTRILDLVDLERRAQRPAAHRG
jgi:CRP-like cAMP-binding protein